MGKKFPVFQRIKIQGLSEEEINMRIQDNESRGWTLEAKHQDVNMVSDWQWNDSKKKRLYNGRPAYERFFATMTRNWEGPQ